MMTYNRIPEGWVCITKYAYFVYTYKVIVIEAYWQNTGRMLAEYQQICSRYEAINGNMQEYVAIKQSSAIIDNDNILRRRRRKAEEGEAKLLESNKY